MGKVFWFDCETTGIDPHRCAVLQVAGLVEIDGEIVETVDLYMRPLKAHEKRHADGKVAEDDLINESALAVNEWTMEEVLEGDHPEVAVASLCATLDNYIDKYDRDDKFICGGKNVKFDIEFLRSCFRKIGNPYFGSYFFSVSKELETLVAEMVAHKGLRLKNYSLETLCAHFDILIDAHEAMSDIVATRALYLELMKELGWG
ncbi:MAG: 3'-5' exonuclease [Desulfosarcinaceae bacterium]|nr:3'-5' exonuclease [Desulfosarcinaceae bacterium]